MDHETKAYCAEVTITNELQSFVDFLAAVQIPLAKAEARTIWEFLLARSEVLTFLDYASVFRIALEAAAPGAEVEKRLQRAFKAVAASLCTNELLRTLRAIINTPSNFAQPLLARLYRRTQYRLSSILHRDPYFIISQQRCVSNVLTLRWLRTNKMHACVVGGVYLKPSFFRVLY